MIVSDFQYLTQIYRLASADTGSPTLTFTSTAHGVLASFEGIHVGAVRRAEGVVIEGLNEDIAVRWETLNGALALFDESATLEARVTGNNLILKAGDRRAQIRLSAEQTSFRWEVNEDDPGFDLDLAKLQRLVTVLTEATARTIERLVLTGVHIACSGENVVCRATDGTRGVAARMPGVGDEMDFVLQGEDLRVVLEVLGGVPARASRRVGGTTITIRVSDTVIRISPLFGEFPSFGSLIGGDYSFTVDVPAAALKLVRRAASIMDSDGLVGLTGDAGVLRLEALGNEFGTFDMVAGKADQEFTRWFVADHLAAAADLGSDTVRIHLPEEPTKPILITVPSEDVRYWMSPVYRRGQPE